MNDPQKLIEEFDKFSDFYDEVVTEHLSYCSHKIVPNMLLKELKIETPEILDLGCGTGLSSTLFFEKKLNVTGIDISPRMIEQAHKRPFKKLLCQNLTRALPFRDKSFDAVLMLGVLEFIETPMQLFKQIYSVLKDDGIVGLTFPTNTPQVPTELTVKKFSDKQITNIFDKSGFEVVNKKSFLGYNSSEYKINYVGYILQKK